MDHFHLRSIGHKQDKCKTIVQHAYEARRPSEPGGTSSGAAAAATTAGPMDGPTRRRFNLCDELRSAGIDVAELDSAAIPTDFGEDSVDTMIADSRVLLDYAVESGTV